MGGRRRRLQWPQTEGIRNKLASLCSCQATVTFDPYTSQVLKLRCLFIVDLVRYILKSSHATCSDVIYIKACQLLLMRPFAVKLCQIFVLNCYVAYPFNSVLKTSHISCYLLSMPLLVCCTCISYVCCTAYVMSCQCCGIICMSSVCRACDEGVTLKP